MKFCDSTRHLCRFILPLILLAGCQKEDIDNRYKDNEWLSGGSQTVFDAGGSAFGHMFPMMNPFNQRIHEIGDMAFEATFVTAPAVLNAGLGPVFNNVSCASCHIGDGRGRPPYPGESLQSLLIRISLDGTDIHGNPRPVPGFGGQLQQRSTAGNIPESEITVLHSYLQEHFADGQAYELSVPDYLMANPYIPFPAGMQYSPRVAPPVFGLGLLEAVTDEDILLHADEGDANGDGISGKPNFVYDVESGSTKLGRFGWKAGQPTLKQQTAGAYSEDMGITSSLYPVESCFDQPQHDLIDDENELSDSLLHAVTFYIRTLAVPARRNADKAHIVEGKQLFNDIGCGSCHRSSMTTRTDVAFPEISNQKIFPYTDLLLHDMGPALADNRAEFRANGQEWRTPPLWGIGLTPLVNGHNNYLHDGRARNLSEAILWHGGEGEPSREKFKKLSASDRKKLVAFLESL